MWNRADLKARARTSFRRNYWKSVLVGLIFMLAAGGAGMGSSASNITSSGSQDEEAVVKEGVLLESGADAAEADEYGNMMIVPELMILGAGFLVVVFAVALFIGLETLLFNPLEVGCACFFRNNLSEPAALSDVGYAFDSDYMNIVKIMFLRDLKILLWSLLFIVPGIVKAYEYQMIPYLLSEDRLMTKEEVFAESRQMMDGQKLNSFVLDLSFLGWNLLSFVTLGILSVFYVMPYMNAAHAALYERLRYGDPQPDLAEIYG
jgi:hypothetical protein